MPSRETEKMFRRANEQASTLKKAPSKGRDYFKSHFNPTYDNDTQPPELFENPPLFVENLLEITSAIQVDTSVPTIDGLRKIILSLKNGKVASDLPPELLKYAAYSDEFLNEVYVVMAEIWTNRRLPADWGISRITTLWKNKGQKSDPSKYRGSSAICKLCMSIILAREKSWYEAQLCEEQQGFRQGRGTQDAIYTIKTLQQIAMKRKKRIYACFIDLTAAFDKIMQPWLFQSIYKRMNPGQDGKFDSNFQIIEELFKKTTAYMTDDPDKKEFDVYGLRDENFHSRTRESGDQRCSDEIQDSKSR